MPEIPASNIEYLPAAGPMALTPSIPIEPELYGEARAKSIEPVRNDAEQELLAGIEEFRNQLARLKTQRLPDSLQSPVAFGPRN